MLYVSIEVNEFIQRLGELHKTQQLAFVHILFNAVVNGGSVRPIFIKKLKRDEGDADGIINEILDEHGILQEDGSYIIQYAVDLVQKAIARSEKAKKAVLAREEIKARQSSTRSSNDHLNDDFRSSNDYPRVKSKELRVKSEDNNPLYIPNGIYAPPKGGAHPSDDFEDDSGEYDDDTDNDDSYCGNDTTQRASSGVNSASSASGDELSVDGIQDEKNGISDDVAPTVQKSKKSKGGLPVRPDFISDQDWASVPMQAWKDWLDYRKSQKKPLTASAWNLFQSVANNANITLGQAVGLVAAKGWLSIKADYKEVQEMRGIVSNDTVRSFASREDSKQKLDIEQSGRTVSRSRGDYSDMTDDEYQSYLEHNPSVYRIEKSIVPKVPVVAGQLTADDAERLGLNPDSLQKCLRYRKEMGQATTEKTIEFFKQVAQAKDVPLAAVLGVRNSAQNINAPTE